MEPIRVLLAEMPQVLRDVFHQIVAKQPDMVVVGGIDDSLGLLLAVAQTAADVVILGLRNAELPGVCSHVLGEYPHVKILAVGGDGRQAVLYELRPQKVPIGEVSPETLLEAIRVAVRNEEVWH